MENKVVDLEKPMNSTQLRDMNRLGWELVQVVAEQFVCYSQTEVSYNTPIKTLYDYRYHHYFRKET